MLKKNNKGMTLVEIVIVLLIASIAMTITGGILVNSLGYFDDSTKASIDKQSVDGILDYIDGEIKYATDVVVAPQKPKYKDNWHCLYVQPSVETNNQNILYRDSDDSPVFSEDYYTKRNLVIEVRGFTVNEHRLDLTLKYKDKNNKEVYKTSKTFELINLNMDTENANNKNLFSNISESTEINSENKLWYRKGTSVTSSDTDDNPVNPTPTPNIVGGNMVGDQIKCWNTSNNRGEMTDNTLLYPRGSFVYYKGFWWQKMLDNVNDNYWPGLWKKPALPYRRWKKICDTFDYTSYYEKGDIVLHNGVKYICTNDFGISAYFEYGNVFYDLGKVVPGHESETPWKKWFKEYVDGDESQYGIHDCRNHWKYNTQTVASNLNNYNLDEIPDFNATSTYQGRSVVRIKYANAQGTGEQYYKYYLKVLSGNGNPGSGASSGWQLLVNGYDSNSAYLKNDVIYCEKDGHYYKALKDINYATDPSNWTYNDDSSKNQVWKKVN